MREPLTASLARIPDLSDDDLITLAGSSEQARPEPTADAGAAPATVAVLDAPAAPDAGEKPKAPLGFTPLAPAPSETVPPTSPAGPAEEKVAPVVPVGRTSPPPPRSWWRRLSFAVALVALVASIPVLVYAGTDLIADSTDGDLSAIDRKPTDPGYEAQVEATPTAVAIQYDETGMPNGLTFLAESGPDGGGSVIFVPLDTNVTEPSFGVDRLRTAYNVVADRPTLARERITSQVGRLLTVGIGETIDLTNEAWTQLVEPVGPLEIENPDALTLADGTAIPSGTVSLEANQVGPYLAATIPGESDLNRLIRHQVVWEAWLTAVGESGRDDIVPGESTAGIARFAQALAKGPITYETLPVTPVEDKPGTFERDEEAIAELINSAVPSPTSAVPGSRFTVRLLNGVAPDSIPSELVRQLIGRGGAVTIIGNGPQFDTAKTEIVYADPAMEDIANLVAEGMGATGKVRLDREAPDTVDLTIVLGEDILGTDGGTGDPGSIAPDTDAGGS